MPTGYLNTQNIDFPHNTDAAYLRGLENRAGVSFQQLLQQIDQRLNAFNSSVPALVASMVTPTTETDTEGGDVIAFQVDEKGEYSMTRPQQASDKLYALPLRDYGAALGFTEKALQNMTRRRILRNIDAMLKGLRRNMTLQALARLFSDSEVPQAKNSAVVCPGFIGSGTGHNVYEGGFADGRALPQDYTHYFSADTDTAGSVEATADAAIDALENFYSGPFEGVATENMLDLLSASEKYVDAENALVRTGDDQARAQVDPEVYEGVYDGKVRVRKALKNSTDSALGIYKSEGQLAEDNPLAWRYDEVTGRGAQIKYRDLYPLAEAESVHEFGVGVNRRAKAVLVSAGSGQSEYTAPVFS